MPGNIAGGKRASLTNRKLYGKDYYSRIGSKGGNSCNKIDPVTGKALKGFAVSNMAAEAGRKGGAKSRRYKKVADGTPQV